MAKHYSVKSFFRDMPAALLARYFHKQGHLQGFDFAPVEKGELDALVAAWLALPEDERKRMEGQFQDIFPLCRDAAIPAMVDEAKWHMQGKPGAHAAFVEMFTALPNNHARAMTLFLDYPECWPNASRLYHADTLPWWRKRKGFPRIPSAKDEASVQALGDHLRPYFLERQSRGRYVLIEQVRRGELDYYFCYLEDYSRQSAEWDGPNFRPRPHNPAFEIVYIWSETEGRLELNYRGDHQTAQPLQNMFAKAILKLPQLPAKPKDDRIYELDKFSRSGFEFRYDAGSGIEDVAVRMIRLSSRVNKGERITVEANPEANPDAVYEALGKLSLPLHLYYVTQVELTASVVTKAGEKPKKVPVRLTWPNSCSLKRDALGDKLRAMLAASDIEPKEPAQGAET
jgi:hypothetical protein